MKKIPTHWIYRTAAALLILALMTSHISSGMMARYRVTSSGGDGARVAKFEVEREGSLLVGGINVHMDPTTAARKCADLTVVNNSETTIRCVPVLKTTENLPVTYFWTTDENGNDASKVITQVEIAPNDSDPVRLFLFAKWSDEEADKGGTYHREIDHVEVVLSCEQVD